MLSIDLLPHQLTADQLVSDLLFKMEPQNKRMKLGKDSTRKVYKFSDKGNFIHNFETEDKEGYVTIVR